MKQVLRPGLHQYCNRGHGCYMMAVLGSRDTTPDDLICDRIEKAAGVQDWPSHVARQHREIITFGVTMPLQNRVDPWGVIFRSPARGTLMGNRGGALHDDRREIVRQYKSRCWIACLLEFKDRRRSVMSPGRYTELFFLDEAVAFAAGHRPCAECRRDRFNAFKDAWMRSHSADHAMPPRAPDIDGELHRTRIHSGTKVICEADSDSLPNGCFVEIDRSAYLVWDHALLLWTPEQYTNRIRRPRGHTLMVLTPQPIVECFRHGYVPQIHPSGSP